MALFARMAIILVFETSRIIMFTFVLAIVNLRTKGSTVIQIYSV